MRLAATSTQAGRHRGESRLWTNIILQASAALVALRLTGSIEHVKIFYAERSICRAWRGGLRGRDDPADHV